MIERKGKYKPITEHQSLLYKHFTEYTNLIYQNDLMDGSLKWTMKCNHFSKKSGQHKSLKHRRQSFKKEQTSETIRFFFAFCVFCLFVFFYLNLIYRNTNLISNATKLQEFSKFTKNTSSPVVRHGSTHTLGSKNVLA